MHHPRVKNCPFFFLLKEIVISLFHGWDPLKTWERDPYTGVTFRKDVHNVWHDVIDVIIFGGWCTLMRVDDVTKAYVDGCKPIISISLYSNMLVTLLFTHFA